jgi:uncharacterized protein YggE
MANPLPPRPPFEITVQGTGNIPHPAERAVINLEVSSTGAHKASVSNEVITTAKHIESLLRELSPTDASAHALDHAALAHWSKTSLSSTSHVPYIQDDPDPARQYTARVVFDIRFRDFKALGSFGTHVSGLAHVEVRNIDWILTEATEKSFRAQLRQEAAKDALQKAQDYCAALGGVNIRPVELSEGIPLGSTMASQGRKKAGGSHGAGFGSMGRSVQLARRGGVEEDGEDFAFDPQEIRMATEVTVKFEADHGS